MEELVCGCGNSQEIGDRQDSRSREHVQDKSPRRFVQVESGIYRDTRTGHFYERFTLDGKRTWRKLVGNNLGLSREEDYSREAPAGILNNLSNLCSRNWIQNNGNRSRLAPDRNKPR